MRRNTCDHKQCAISADVSLYQNLKDKCISKLCNRTKKAQFHLACLSLKETSQKQKKYQLIHGLHVHFRSIKKEKKSTINIGIQ